MLGIKSQSVKDFGKKTGKTALGIGKKAVKVAGTAAAILGAGVKIHSIITDQSVGDSAVDLIEGAKDVKETATDVVKGQKAKADVERIMDDDKETKLQKAKAVKNVAAAVIDDKNKRNAERQANRMEKPSQKAEKERQRLKDEADKEKQRKDREDKSRIARQMKEAEVNLGLRNRNAKREECYGTTKSGKKGRMNLNAKDKKKCDKKHK